MIRLLQLSVSEKTQPNPKPTKKPKYSQNKALCMKFLLQVDIYEVWKGFIPQILGGVWRGKLLSASAFPVEDRNIHFG